MEQIIEILIVIFAVFFYIWFGIFMQKHYGGIIPFIDGILKKTAGKIKSNLDYSKIDNIEFEDIDHSDLPDYCDTYISSAHYRGREMTEEELETINEDKDFVYEKLMDHLH